MSEEFEEELYRENLYFVYEDKCRELEKEIDKLVDTNEDINREFSQYKYESKKEIERLNNIIKEVREYIENNSLYEQDYDYDYEENLVEYPPSDEQAKKDILGILDKVD